MTPWIAQRTRPADVLELDVCHPEDDPWEATCDALTAGLAVVYDLVTAVGPGGGWPVVRFTAVGSPADRPRALRVLTARYAGDDDPASVARDASADAYRPRALYVRDARRSDGWRFVRTTDDRDALAGVTHARQAAEFVARHEARRGSGTTRVHVLPDDVELLDGKLPDGVAPLG